MNQPILPGATLGVFGGGQLGRMFALAARRIGYRVHLLAPEASTPTEPVADQTTQAGYDDVDAIRRFARSVDVITYEFENIPTSCIEAAAQETSVRPSGALLQAAQERIREKSALQQLGLPVARHATIASAADLETAKQEVPFPAIMKTASWGYDGKGQVRVTSAAQLHECWEQLGSVRVVLESVVPFVSEISAIVARSCNGEVIVYPPFLNHHERHILDVTLFPAPVSPQTVQQAEEIARTVATGFDVFGVLCVEMFLLEDHSLVVNEIAPRPHNSGHVTIEACPASQFEQQVRGICGLPLGAVTPIAPAAAMANLLGDLWQGHAPQWVEMMEDRQVHLHLYGKGEARPGRKMGHLTVLESTLEAAEQRVRAARHRINPTR